MDIDARPEGPESTRCCPRCRGPLTLVLVLGQLRERCPKEPCDSARQRRRAMQAVSADRIRRGELSDAPGRLSVDEMCWRYSDPNGPKFAEARDEALEMLVRGSSLGEVIEACGERPARHAADELRIKGLAREKIASSRRDVA